MINKTKKLSGKRFIPKFYDSRIDSLGLDNYKVVTDSDGNIRLYITPIIRTILLDTKNQIPKNTESLGRTIKEKMCPYFRMLLKNSLKNSKIILINNKQFLLSNSIIFKLDNNKFRILNDNSYKNSKVI